jgi:hypothetical protein
MILSGAAVQVKGFGLALSSTRQRLIAACRPTTDKKTPRFNRRLVNLAKKRSTALSQDADVGMKWKVRRGCRASQQIMRSFARLTLFNDIVGAGKQRSGGADNASDGPPPCQAPTNRWR